MSRSYKMWVSCAISCVLLGGVATDRALLHAASKNADDYHAQVRKLADAIPTHVGDWVSEEAPVPQAAVALLRPNVVMSRQYQNVRTGEQASFLLVQCRDARDLVGHYPPNCYVAHGCTLVMAQPCEWKLGDLNIHGTMYKFNEPPSAGMTSMNIFDFMILPDGRTAPDMAGVYAVARRRNERSFGAAQIQILTNSNMSNEDRTKVINTILASAKPVIDEIRTGASQ